MREVYFCLSFGFSFDCRLICLFICLAACLFVRLFVCLPFVFVICSVMFMFTLQLVWLPVFVYLSCDLSAHLFVCLLVYISHSNNFCFCRVIYLFICPYVCFFVCLCLHFVAGERRGMHVRLWGLRFVLCESPQRGSLQWVLLATV